MILILAYDVLNNSVIIFSPVDRDFSFGFFNIEYICTVMDLLVCLDIVFSCLIATTHFYILVHWSGLCYYFCFT